MIRCLFRGALAVTLAALLSSSAVRVAHAVEERVWASFELGANLYDPEQALRDAVGFGVRGTGFLNRWVGIEGLYSTSSAKQDPTNLDATFSHYGGGLIFTPQRNAWALPYLYGGLGSVKVKRDGLGDARSSGAFHLGAGAVFRAGERLGIRLDARDVSYEQKDGPGRQVRVNEFQISTGVTAFWMGRPRDSDEDGVPNKGDRCPATPEGAVVDAGGCPLDTDGDKVFDGLDKCASTPNGALVDAGGCPLDADADGVFDGIDTCGETAKGILVDAQGCPMDSDGDKVSDGPDQCPDTPKGSLVNADGCPLDADQDGVPDGVDSCPYTLPGVPVNAGGCPLAQSPLERDLMDDWIIRLSDLEFVPDSITLTPQGLARVDEVGALMEQWPMLKFEVGVHSDNLGEDARRQPLSHLRARGILQQIYAKHPSVNPKNYFYTGYGDTKPLGSNKTPQGRAMNRRAEFKLLNMDALTAERARRESLGTTAAPPAPGLGMKSAVPPPEPMREPGPGAATPSSLAPGAPASIPPATPSPPDTLPPPPPPPDSR